MVKYLHEVRRVDYGGGVSSSFRVGGGAGCRAIAFGGGEVARQWSIMTLYNGAAGCQPLTVLDRPRERSPIFFDPTTSSWHLSTNENDYAPRVIEDSELEETD